MRALLRAGARKALPPGFDVETHFGPPYQPWDQRMCVLPDGDLFRALRSGRAEVVTDRVATFTPDGIELASGRTLPADIVVLATGLALQPVGGMTLRVDGAPVILRDTVCYKGMMLSGVHQNYLRDVVLMRRGPVEDEGIVFSRGRRFSLDGAAAAGPAR